MIEKCKICDGKGYLISSAFGFGEPRRVCPACKGAGEFDVRIPLDRRTTCKFCNGNGFAKYDSFELGGALGSARKVCNACKGLGFVEIPVVGFGEANNHQNVVEKSQTPRLMNYKYDVAISYAGEDRKIVEEYTKILTSSGLAVFYDKDRDIETELWGTNLYDVLDEIYRLRARYCVIFISENYAQKIWTNHERESAQARALEENREYILPVRLDDTEIPGLHPTIKYLDLNGHEIEEIAEITIKKVRKIKNESLE